MPGGEALCGVFTRDYRHEALNSQVLITVPACFEILLLAPHRQNWVKRIRYVIFDEVHCLGGEIGAEIWEHLLVMIRCPFLALSATISNPQHLTEWLQSVKRYWKQVDSTMEQGSVSQRNAATRGSYHKDRVQARQSYKVRLGTYALCTSTAMFLFGFVTCFKIKLLTTSLIIWTISFFSFQCSMKRDIMI